MKFSRGVVKSRFLIVIITLVLMVPSAIGMLTTRINYDMLNYLPSDMDTVIGQNELLEDFGKGAFSFIVVENMEDKAVSALKAKIEKVNHVDSVIWYDSIFDISVPKELLPEKLYSAFNTETSTMMAVFFDTSTSADETITAINTIRGICDKNCYVTGMSALVTDLKNLCEEEEPIYVAIAVVMALLVMLVFLDSFLVPIIFLASIGMMILLNLGTNFFFGEISYITKALSAVLQLAVTMDYSIFLWHSYNEELEHSTDKNEAMAVAIKNTLSSVVGSSITTVAGFIALCFMSFTLGMDLGLVMAKGVVFGVIGCVTVLPSLVLIFDKPLQKTKHKALIPKTNGLVSGIIRFFPVILVLFVALIVPSYYGYSKTNNEVYYDFAGSLPQDMDYIVAQAKLKDQYNMANIHMVLVDSGLSEKNVRGMIREMEEVPGVSAVLGLETVLGSQIPREIIPESIKSILISDDWEMLLITSEYATATDEMSSQITDLNKILDKYDRKGMLIGEACCTQDMIEVTDHDFKVVNAVSIIAIFLIIAIVEKSISLPLILISVIEFAIFVNLGLPHYLGQSLPFIAPICISTIQLGATVDYAILMTTRYKKERIDGNRRSSAVKTALSTSIPSILVSGFGLCAATLGVAIYSNVDMISSLCMLMARGAVISMCAVIFILPALLLLFDKLVCKTTLGMTKIKDKVMEA